MQIFLLNMCSSLTGSLSKRHGYSIKHRKNGFFGVRNPENVPRDGHWRFIVDCAIMAQDRFMISDIEVPQEEMHEALLEAGYRFIVPVGTYNAKRVLELNKLCGI